MADPDFQSLAREARLCAETASSPNVAKCWIELEAGYRKMGEQRIDGSCGTARLAGPADTIAGRARYVSHSSRLASAIR